MIAKANLSQPFWPYFCEALALAIDEEQQPGRKRGKAVFRFLAKVAIKGFCKEKLSLLLCFILIRLVASGPIYLGRA